MKYNPEKHNRRSIRLKEWDYSDPGAYFVTVCTQNRDCLLGEIQNGKMKLNRFGAIILEKWNRIPNHFKNVQLDAFQIMPNHIHGILFIIDVVGAKHSRSVSFLILPNGSRNASPLHNRPNGTQPGSVSAIMQNYQSQPEKSIKCEKRQAINYGSAIIMTESFVMIPNYRTSGNTSSIILYNGN